MYAVVTLQDSDEVMLAASRWLSTDKKQCYWPPFRSEEKCVEAVQKRFKPETDGKPWEKLNISFHREYSTFDEAKKEQKEIKEQKERSFLLSTSFPGILKRQRLENTREISKNPLHSVTPASTSRMTTDDMNAIFKMLRDIKRTVDENSSILKKLKDNPVSDAPSSTSSPSTYVHTTLHLPLRTVDDLARTEKELKDAKGRQKYIKHLSRLGGVGPNDVIKNIMQHLLTEDLANDFNWQGRGNKKAFSRLILTDVIKDAASKHGVLSGDCETEIKKYLWSIPDRISRKRPRDYRGLSSEVSSPTMLDSDFQNDIGMCFLDD